MGRFLAIDFGEKRIGLALSDPMKIIAKPFKTIFYSNQNDLINKIALIIKDEKIEKIILGLPKGLKGNNTSQTNIVIEFYKYIKDKIDTPIVMEDERLSSVSAKKSLILQDIKTGHNKALIDETAAAIFLQLYLDKN
ncbi:MAG: Holliday junction resolvase RuvX [Candidatus Marinimicrobia bacterium]|nr:Holliday junction resolvase RuvX [Candidatus Neomarinimicrobiota bacterium]|tara:strand:- start:698 stop:1108 length:411 start_codon:yes stop_codon:yes gene_type:complete